MGRMLPSSLTTGAAAGSCSASGRVAVVTGANKGVGYFIALQLGMSGLFQHVLLACRDSNRASTAVQSIQAALDKENKQVHVWTAPLTLGDVDSHKAFASNLEEMFGGKIDVLVNNAAIAYKGSDPTPFQEQCKPTLDVNFRGTVDFTERMIPFLRKGTDARIVNVASMAGGLYQITNPQLKQNLTKPDLIMEELHSLMNQFEHDVLAGQHRQSGWGNSNYGMSKLAVIAATRIWARTLFSDAAKISVNSCCPGYCRTDMSSNKGGRDPADGAKNAVLPATVQNPPTGQHFADYRVADW